MREIVCRNNGRFSLEGNGEEVSAVLAITEGKETGTLYLAHRNKDFDLMSYIHYEC